MAGPGTGYGLQGTPPIQGQYFNERQRQEEARKNAKIKRDDEAYQRILEETVIRPGEYDWKVETKAREAVADFTYQVNKLRQEHPTTWENMVPQLKQDTFGKLQGYRSDTVALKAIRDAKKTGKYYVPESAGKYLDTDQGNMKGGLPGLVDQKLYGFIVDPETGHLGFNPVEKRNLQSEFEKHITSREKSYQYELDPATGQPKVNVVKGVDGASRQFTKRMLLPPQVDDLYAGITTDPHLSQNINIAYAEELKKRPDYNDAMIVTPDGNFNPEFLKGAARYGRELAGNMARNYFTTENLNQPAKTNVNVNVNNAKEMARTVSAISEETLKAGKLRGQVADKNNPKLMVDDIEVFDVKTPAQFTTSGFKAKTAKSGTVVNLKTGKKEETPGVDNAEYAQFAVVPVYTGRNDKLGEKGALVKGDWENLQGDEFLTERLKKGEIEWKVVGIGSYTEKKKDRYGDEIEDEKSIIRDADELIGAAAVPLSEPDVKDFKRNIETLKAKARTLNQGAAQPDAIKNNQPPRSAVPTATKDKVLKKISMAAAKAKNPGKSDEQIRTIYKQYGYEVE